MIEDPETIQNHTVIEINDLDELKNLINGLPEGTVYSLNLEVIELGKESITLKTVLYDLQDI
jgi:hypothetical protein